MLQQLKSEPFFRECISPTMYNNVIFTVNMHKNVSPVLNVILNDSFKPDW